jgi:hypothetical protein
MHYSTGAPRPIEDDSAQNAKVLRARLDKYLARERELVAQQLHDAAAWEWKRDLPPLRREIVRLQREVALHERNAGITERDTNASTPALGSGGSFWRNDRE